MGKKFERGMADAMKGLIQAQEGMREDLDRHEKILDAQARQIVQLQDDVMEMRNRAIAAAAMNRTPYKEISALYGLSEGRISQIKKQYQS